MDFDDFIDQETAWRVFGRCGGKVYKEYSEFKSRLNMAELDRIKWRDKGLLFRRI